MVDSESVVCGPKDCKESLIKQLDDRLGSFAVNIFCAQIDSSANAQTCYNRFADAATAAPSKTTSFLGELLENKIDPRKGPVVGVICHDLSYKAQQDSFNWFAGYASRFHGLSSNTLAVIKDKNGAELFHVPIRVYEFRHHY
ncbi:MAG: hypothetical protein ABII09_07160 [Planctomycetota bacterium]